MLGTRAALAIAMLKRWREVGVILLAAAPSVFELMLRSAERAAIALRDRNSNKSYLDS